MKTIRTQTRCFGFAAVIGLAACTLLYILHADGFSSHIAAFIFLAAGTAVIAVLALRGLHLLQAARLIAENELLHICPAVIQAKGGRRLKGAALVVSISCFGILLDTRVIRFNQKSNRLRRVEIGRDYINLSWGTEKRPRSATLLRPSMDAAEIQKIAERFLFETGVQPVVAQDCK